MSDTYRVKVASFENRIRHLRTGRVSNILIVPVDRSEETRSEAMARTIKGINNDTALSMNVRVNVTAFGVCGLIS